jgi:hypothetical protein
MNYDELIERRYELVIELADVERQLLKFNKATLFVEKKRKRPERKQLQATQLSEDWWPTPELLESARDNVPGVSIGVETEKFKNYYISRGKKMKNWAACWKNWLLQAEQYQEMRSN